MSWKQSLRGKRRRRSHKNSLIKKTLIKFTVHSFIKFILNSYLKGMYLPICASLYINYCQNLTIIMIKALLVLKIRKDLSGCNYAWLLWTMSSTDDIFWWKKKNKTNIKLTWLNTCLMSWYGLCSSSQIASFSLSKTSNPSTTSANTVWTPSR